VNPTQSPDLNIIEAVWDHQNQRQPTSKEENWRTTPEDYLKKLQDSLSKTAQAALKNKGARTKYRLSSLLELNKLLQKLITACLSHFSGNINKIKFC